MEEYDLASKIDLAPTNEIEQQIILSEKISIGERLNLEHLYPGMTEQIRERIAEIIAETFVEVRGMLSLPPCDFIAPTLRDDEYTYQATTRVTHNREGNLVAGIMFHRQYILEAAQYLKNPIVAPYGENHLRATVAHELYHAYTFLKYPTVAEMEPDYIGMTNKYESKRLWRKDVREFAAELFALSYIQQRRASANWKDNIGRIILELHLSHEVRAMKKARS